MANAFLPILDDIVARGINKLVARRPSAGPFVISGKGRYADIFAGWKAQLTLLRARLVDEAVARRLVTAEKRPLVELAASEFFAELLPTATTAVGSVTLDRAELAYGAGVIKEGTRFKVEANPSASPPVKEARYVTIAPYYVDAGQFRTAPIPIQATSAGTDGNLPRFEIGASAPLLLDDTIFDPTFTVWDSEAAGGSTGVRDEDIRHLARALYVGQTNPTDGALIAGALTDAAVKQVALVRDRTLGRAILFIADESWSWSLAFQSQCKQALKDAWLGWGARLEVRPIYNRLVAINATAVLADPKFADDTSELRTSVREAVRAYLDERPDFYTFDLNAIGATIAGCDDRLLTCTSVEVVDFATGAPLTPTPISADSYRIDRYYLTDNGVKLTLTAPA